MLTGFNDRLLILSHAKKVYVASTERSGLELTISLQVLITHLPRLATYLLHSIQESIVCQTNMVAIFNSPKIDATINGTIFALSL